MKMGTKYISKGEKGSLLMFYLLFVGIYLTCTMAITTLSMVLTVFVLNLHHITDRPVPHWVKRLVLVYLARMMGICIKLDDDKERKVPKTKNRRTGGLLGNHVTKRRTSVRLHEGDDTTAIIELHQIGNSSNQSPLHTANGDTERTSLIHDKVYTDNESAQGSPRAFHYGTSIPTNQKKDTKQLEQGMGARLETGSGSVRQTFLLAVPIGYSHINFGSVPSII